MRQVKFFILITLTFAFKYLAAQNPYILHYTTADGLPSNGVYTIFQDSKKFIWFTTDGGVARYDGSRFTYYRKQDGLSSNDIFDIKEDSFGRIWFFNINASLNFFYNNTIYNDKNAPFLDSLKGIDFSKKFYEDENKIIYIYDNPQRIIFSLDPNNHVTKYKLPSMLVQSDLSSVAYEGMNIRYMKKNENGEFFFRTASGYFKTKELSIKPVLINNKFKFKDIITSSANHKYILLRANNSKKIELKRFNDESDFTEIKPLANCVSDYISSILEDNSGILWISTYDKGVYCFKSGKLIYHFNIKNAKTIIQDHENNIWISSLKEGVFKINPFFNQYKHFGNTAFQNNGVFSICLDDSLGIWCTNGELVYLLRDNELFKLGFQHTENSFNQILKVNHQTLIVGETSKLPFALQGIRFDQQEKKILVNKVSQSQNPLKKIIDNKQLNQINTYNQFYLYFIHPDRLFSEMKTEKITERIYNIYYNRKNELILNAKKNYIFQSGIAKEYKELSYFNTKIITEQLNLNDSSELFNIEGDSLFILHNNRIFNLSARFENPIEKQIKHLEYHDSTLFIATSGNIYICENPLNILKKEPVYLRLIDINFRSINDILFNENKLYVASNDGLTVIPQRDLFHTIIHSPIPYFQSIQVNDKENQVKQDHISLISSERVNIIFSCINYSISPITYSYKLEGSDDNWTVIKGNNVILQNLSKGNYKFKLRAKKPASEWSEPIDFGIEVQATIWQNPLLYFILILFLAGIIFLIIIRRKNIELDRRQMEHQIILLEQKSLQAMMNPHFIFNTLGSIQNYLLHNKPYEAGIYLSQFARLIRQNLNTIDTSMINLEEELDRLKNYLDLEKLRMGDKFEYNIEIDEAVESDKILIPTMIIQPIVENAIWHGIANMDGKGIIGVSVKSKNEKSLQIIVEDSGVGITNAQKFSTRNDLHLKLGMNITRKRLNLLSQKYGVETDIQYSERSPGMASPGTKVIILFPFLHGKTESHS